MQLQEITRAITRLYGIETLNPMQTAVSAASAHEIILISPTGSGKTLAFTIAMLKRLEPNAARRQAVVISPSRELARQITDVVRPLAATFGLKTLAIYGGNSFRDEEASLTAAVPDILVATPGRLLDHLERGTMEPSRLTALIYDEYDKILELGFHDELKKIARRVGEAMDHRRPELTMLCSATRLKELPEFLNLTQPEEIDFSHVGRVESRLRIVRVPSPTADKLTTLAALVRSATVAKGQCIVFVNHRESADRVGAYLKSEKISAVVYHGGLDQQQREIALACFAARAAKVLVSTDLAGRGLDIENVDTVIHYHQTQDVETWTHRNGRTARVDRTGEVYVITGPEEGNPDFVDFAHDFYPDMTDTKPVAADFELVYLDRGKRNKISRGDVAGFVMKKAEIPATAVGKISVGTDYALVAVGRPFVKRLIEVCKTEKLKNTRVRASLVD